MIEKRQLHKQISARLAQIDFDAIWTGFHMFKFAVYDRNEVCFGDTTIPWEQQFVGCTSITYEGEQIAIWDLDSSPIENLESSWVMDIDELASMLVHEMFHAFQFESGEQRWPQDLLTMKYPMDEENYFQKYTETQLLVNASRESDPLMKKEYLSRYCELRKKRSLGLGRLHQCEEFTETAEGMAEYAGMLALLQLSKEKYDVKKEHDLTLLTDQIQLYFDIRMISYYCGAILMLTAKEAGISLAHTVGKCNETTFELLKNQLSNETVIKRETFMFQALSQQIKELPQQSNPSICKNQQEHEDELKSLIHEKCLKLLADKQEKITSFQKASNKEWIHGEYIITGYDPMNMFRYHDEISDQDMVLATHFVQLTSVKDQKTETFMQPVLLSMYMDAENLVNAYLVE